MMKNVVANTEDYAKRTKIYEKFSKIVAESPEIEYAVPLGADIILHKIFFRTKLYNEYCIMTYGGHIQHNSELYGTERFWNAWANTCNGFQKKFGLCIEREKNNGNYLLNPSECAIMKLK
jgi:hypothetical protein